MRTTGWRRAALILGVCLAAETASPAAVYAAAVPDSGREAQADTPAAGPALGEGLPQAQEEPVYSKEELEDSVLAYGEISGRIENYNTTYRNLNTQLYRSTTNIAAARDLAEEADERMEDAFDIKSSEMDAETRALYEGYRDAAQELRKQAQKMTNSELSGSGERTLRHTKNQLVKTVQNLYLQYEAQAAQEAALQKSEELAQARLEEAQARQALGGAAARDVLMAQRTLTQARSGALQLEAGLSNLRQNLLILLGFPYNAPVEFEPVTPPEESRIAAMNPQADRQAAVWANYDLQTIKQTAADGSAARGNKQRNVAMTEQTVAIQLENLYAGVMAKRQAFEGVKAQYEAAQKSWQAAQAQNALGMLGRADYLQAEYAWLSSQAAYTAAVCDYERAAGDYEWAVKGLILADAG